MAESISELAAALRRLRLEQGGPTYEALARTAGLSRSTVAEAFAGGRLPSERTLFAVVDALGDDPAAWLADRAMIAGLGTSQQAAPDGLREGGSSGRPTSGATTTPVVDGRGEDVPAGWWDRTPTLRLLVPLLVVAVAIGALATRLWWPREVLVGAGAVRGRGDAMVPTEPPRTWARTGK